jgi:tetratricopeptide (TPR) repeat protein
MKTTVILLLAIVLLEGTVSFTRNPVFRDEITLWSDVILKNQRSARGFFNLGCSYSDLDQEETAIRLYTRALMLDPEHVTAYLNRGNAYDKQGMSASAIEDYRRALSLSPGNALIYYNLGVTYENNDDREMARVHYEEACRLGNPDGCLAMSRLTLR